MNELKQIFLLRDAALADYPRLLEMNQAEIPKVSHLDQVALQKLADQCVYFKLVVDHADEPVAFLMALREGQDYSSENYRWFSERMEKFIYIDRIVVKQSHHRLGLGRKLYEDLAAFARSEKLVRTCEVNIEPPNPTSQDFHARMGFKKMGEQWTKSNSIQVAMLFAEATSD